MPSTGVAPPPPLPSTPIESASQQAVATGSLTTRAKVIAGTIQAAASTTPGALGTSFGTTAGFATVNNITTGEPATAALSWLVTFWYQGAKERYDNNRWFVLGLMAIMVGFFVWWANSPDHDPLKALAKALENAGPMMANAVANFKTTKPLGWFESGDDQTVSPPQAIPIVEEVQDEPGGVRGAEPVDGTAGSPGALGGDLERGDRGDRGSELGAGRRPMGRE